MSDPITQGAHHIGLTVPNIEATGAFFRDVLGYDQVGEKPDYPAVFLSDGNIMITLWQVADPATAAPFDRRNVTGLHHLALKVDGRESLDALHAVLAAHDEVTVEFAPEPLGAGPTAHMMCAVPGGVRVEFIAPGG